MRNIAIFLIALNALNFVYYDPAQTVGTNLTSIALNLVLGLAAGIAMLKRKKWSLIFLAILMYFAALSCAGILMPQMAAYKKLVVIFMIASELSIWIYFFRNRALVRGYFGTENLFKLNFPVIPVSVGILAVLSMLFGSYIGRWSDVGGVDLEKFKASFVTEGEVPAEKLAECIEKMGDRMTDSARRDRLCNCMVLNADRVTEAIATAGTEAGIGMAMRLSIALFQRCDELASP